MFLRWRDELRVALTPQRVTWVHIPAWWRRRPCEHSHAEVLADPRRSLWLPALEALAEGLAQRRTASVRTTVVLSNHLVRFAVIPWSDRLCDPRTERSLARITFEHLHGDVSKQWTVKCSPSGYGLGRLASAVDTDLLDRLKFLCTELNLPLVSVQPFLMAACNAVRRSLRTESGQLVVCERERITIARFRGDRWLGVTNMPAGASPHAELAEVLRRDAVLHGAPADIRTYLFDATGQQKKGVGVAGVEGEVVGPKLHSISREELDDDIAMALTGAY